MRTLAFYLACTFILFSCGKDTPENEKSVVDKVYEIAPWQTLSADGSELRLVLRDVEASECVNSVHDLTAVFGPNSLKLDIFGTIETGDCDPGESYPQSQFELAQNDGRTEVTINIDGGDRVTGDIEIEAFDMTLKDFENSDQIIINHFNMKKINERVLWGSVYGTDQIEVDQVKEAIDGHLNFGPTIPLPALPDGYYGHFTIEDGVLELPNDAPTSETILYRHDSATDWEDLGIFLDELQTKFPEAQFIFFNFDGQIKLSQ